MFKLLWLIPVLIAGLTSCSSNFVPAKVDANGEYIGWHCEGDVNSKDLWRCSKTVMKDGMPVASAATVADNKDESLMLDPANSEPAPAVLSEQAPPILSSEVSVLPADGFTIQVGAFTDREVAMSVIEALASPGDIRIVDIVVKGTNFSAVILGNYASVSEAQQAADQLLKDRSSYWIRSMRSLNDAAIE
ncbi:MAG: SPOR domain-containing protein [Porticoccaceae bacterium]|nr:SPOR domain-containing protein [Porticoccaceae bacterium]